MLTGRGVGAAEAMVIGLASRVVDDAALQQEALGIARTIAANSPYAIKHTKQIMWANLGAANLEAALELENHVETVAMLTTDFREGCLAFAEKRAPHFRGS
jgi:enoyl-CoA hydratase